MKRLLIVAACAALLMSGCRTCGGGPFAWLRRGAPCRSSLSFDPYTSAPAAAAPVCGVDAYAGEIGCGQDVTYGYGTPDCPNCQVGGPGYYDNGLQAVPPQMEYTPIPGGASPGIGSGLPTPPTAP